ncbi:TetR/AcrR family transcriptional regulator [Paenibacillus sp. BR2-3]|uniref:TetR/AcrR family transcriptional regulator n=1 Tax=Paenibacillus sp. BR2-3 TaxID=3048494 RepID=UPI00397745C9
MNGFEKRAALIKEKIMKTTLEMLNTWEPKRMRIADIAKTAGVSQVTIYNYFGSKEALLKETFKDYIQRSIREFEEYISEKRSLKEIIEYTLIKEKESYSAIPPAIVKELMIDDPEMFRYIQEHYESQVIPLIARMVEDGRKRGEISEKVSVSAVLMLMRMYVQSSGEMLEAARNQDNPDAFLEEIVHLFFYGLCGREQE